MFKGGRRMGEEEEITHIRNATPGATPASLPHGSRATESVYVSRFIETVK